MLLLPRPPFRPIYYTIVLVDLCKALPGAFPAVLAGAVRALFSRAAIMDVECRTRVIQWLAHHLSNFAFVWPWAAWAAVARQPEWAPQRVFVSEVLEREIRLSYYDKIRESLGSAEMEQLLPPKPEPVFKFKRNRAAGPGRLLAPAEGEGEGEGRGGKEGGGEGEKKEGEKVGEGEGDRDMKEGGEGEGGEGGKDGEKDGGQGAVQQYGEGVDAAAVEVAEEVIVMVRTKRAGKEVAAWVEEQAVGKVGGDKGRALDVVAQTLLVLGSKSITHAVTVLERYGLALQLLAPDQPSQVQLLHSIWAMAVKAHIIRTLQQQQPLPALLEGQQEGDGEEADGEGEKGSRQAAFGAQQGEGAQEGAEGGVVGEGGEGSEGMGDAPSSPRADQAGLAAAMGRRGVAEGVGGAGGGGGRASARQTATDLMMAVRRGGGRWAHG
ncbi:unnamed protein product [Closterium sp. NIES-53]